MRIVDLFFAFPFLVLVIAIIAMLGPSIFNMFVAIWITSWVSYARIMRAQTVVAKKQQYVLAAARPRATAGCASCSGTSCPTPRPP